jgi:methyl-accepting chemotaxis protein
MNALRNLKLRTKLLASFFFVSLLTLAVGIYGSIKLHEIDDNDTKLYEQNTVPLAQIASVAVNSQRIRANAMEAIQAKDKAGFNESAERIRQFREENDKHLVEYEKNISSVEERSMYEKSMEHRKRFCAILDQVLALAGSGKAAEAQELLEGEGRSTARAYQDAVDKLMESNTTQAKATSDANTASANAATNIMYAVIALSIALSIALGLLLTSNVSAQLGEDPGYLGEVARSLAAGPGWPLPAPQDRRQRLCAHPGRGWQHAQATGLLARRHAGSRGALFRVFRRGQGSVHQPAHDGPDGDSWPAGGSARQEQR